MQKNCSDFINKSDITAMLAFEHIKRVGSGYYSLPIASIGLILVSLYIASIIRAMIYRRVSRKCCLLLMDRAFGDVLACCVAIGIGVYVIVVKEINEQVTANAEILLMGTFWSSMVSYVSLSLVRLLAVARPITYKNIFTMRRCIYLIIISWTLYFCVVIPLLVMRQLMKIPALRKSTGCTRGTCRAGWIFRNAVTMTCYPLTVVIFLTIVIYLRRARRHVTGGNERKFSAHSAKVLKYSIRKLGYNVATFAFFYSFQMAHSIYMIMFNRNPCLYQEKQILMITIHAYIRNIMLLRIIADPIISFCVDKPLRRSFLHIMGMICDAEPKTPGRSKAHDLTNN